MGDWSGIMIRLRGQRRLLDMQIDIAFDARSGVAEGPFWDADDGVLWWVDITRKEVLRWRPGTETPRRWPVPDFPSVVVLRRRSGCPRGDARRAILHGARNRPARLFLSAEERPDNRNNEGKVRCARPLLGWYDAEQSQP
jgi:sugar lactone lactonase YvrE